MKKYFYADINARCGAVYHNDETMPGAEFCSGNEEIGDGEWNLGGGMGKIITHREAFDGTTAIRQCVTFTNTSSEPLTLDSMASLFVPDIGAEGEKKWNEDRFVVHYARMAWQGEGQWHHDSLKALGLYSTYNHGNQPTIRFSSVGSWTTAQIYPMVMLEDLEKKETWYFEIESPTNWFIEISSHGYMQNSSLCVMLSAAHENNDGWFRTLAPGENFTTVPAVYGKVSGGFEDAIRELNNYKRITNKAKFASGVTPVCFNDYMNCLWAQPSKDRLIPLIDKAANVGCEVFCIDAGWFGKRGEWSVHNGDYEPYDELFPEIGFKGIISYIASKNMLPGAWLEIETADINSDFVKAHPDCLLTRHGHAIGGGQCFLDFRQQLVRDHIMGVFDRLYNIGVRYIKNDYNHTTGVNIDAEDGISGVEALREHGDTFAKFIDEVIATHPGLIIENCGSGAMRCSDGVLKHFHLQSTSDQEYYNRYPSIVQGMTALMPPEKAGIWSYPLPVDFHEREIQLENYPIVIDHIIEDAKSGVQTAFNMVNAMMGALYLSGRICYANELNTSLIKDAISLYKNARSIMKTAHPVYPTGTILLDHQGFATLGLIAEDQKKLYLAVWKIECEETVTEIDLSKYLTANASISNSYPALDGFNSSLSDCRLNVTMPEKNAAMWIEISL